MFLAGGVKGQEKAIIHMKAESQTLTTNLNLVNYLLDFLQKICKIDGIKSTLYREASYVYYRSKRHLQIR